MNKSEVIKECLEMMNYGASPIEIFEYIEDNTDLDPTEIMDAIYKKQVFGFQGGNMTNFINDVYAFNREIIGTQNPVNPTNLTRERLLFALTAMYEELYEFTKACNSNDVGESLDAIIDLIYFAIGRAYEMGISEEQFIRCWKAVQQKNMQKKKGTKNRGTATDAIKPQGWKAADLGELLK